jgi:hypothetical protein
MAIEKKRIEDEIIDNLLKEYREWKGLMKRDRKIS